MTSTTTDNFALIGAVEHVARASRIRRLRTIREFAEQEITLPTGPYQGERFRADRLPWVGLWFDAIDYGPWRRYGLSGVGQGGKTLAGSAIPVMYHLFEHRETVVYAAPSIEMANDKWRQDILPVIEASNYRDLIPDSGRGSKGGTVLSLTFKNGATLRFMTGGGGDKVRAGFTSRISVITEADGFDSAGEQSRETDPFNQIEARTAAYGDRARVYFECTVSTETGRIWRELKGGTDSRIVIACPHCRQLVTPEREHLIGWQDATNVMEARESAKLICPSCGVAWSEVDRIQANRAGKLVHKGQEIPGNTITGIAPRTLTLGMRFTATNNLLVPMARVAEEEWNAPRTTDTDLAEKKLRQFYWAIPTEPESVTLSTIDTGKIAARITDSPRGRVPSDAIAITLGVDCGKWLHHWVAIAWRAGGTPHVLEYGRLDVPSSDMAEELAILTALRRFRDEIVSVGWPVMGGGDNVKPSLVLVDSGNWEATVVSFCAESGIGCLPTKGFGIQQIGRRALMHEPGYEIVAQAAGFRLVEVNADFWKSYVHSRLQTPVGQPGGLTLFHATTNEHLSFSKHLVAERKVEEFIAGRGLVTRWERQDRNNHFLDALALACVAGHGVGQRIIGDPTPAPMPSQQVTPTPRIKPDNWIMSYKGRW